MSDANSRIRSFLSRHLFAYLAALALLVVVLAFILARKPLHEAWQVFDRSLILPVLALSLLNYWLRFAKWDFLLKALKIRVPFVSNARIYFSCLTMVVTPFRLGEVYKLVFLRRQHGHSIQSTTPVLLVDRITDAFALTLLALVGIGSGQKNLQPRLIALLLVTLLGGFLLGRPWVQKLMLRLLRKIPWTAKRADSLGEALRDGARLFSTAKLLPALLLSLGAWFAECVGLYLILVGLGTSIPLVQASWIYAGSTIAGNLTLLPGGLVGTEALLIEILRQSGITLATATAATLLVRGATLWFAVLLGLVVTFTSRRELRWKELRRETDSYSSSP